MISLDHDVLILGGGLAGLTLALQLRDTLPEARIAVLERSSHPVPESAHKVGESTVEIGAEYLASTLGLREHLDRCHLRKYGLRLFFDADRADDLSQAGELGASHLLSLPSYQVDRGVLENHLAELAGERGIELITSARVRDVHLDPDDDTPHRVEAMIDGQTREFRARWVVDALGRASLIKRKLDLAEANNHYCSSVWFRIQDRIDVADWSTDADWQSRCSQLPRWHSTNHLMGPGYWVWLIPLASGATSIGIVFDRRVHDFDRLKRYEGVLNWLAQHQPRCHRALTESTGELMDFLYLRHISHGCRQVFSDQRWALTGEAGVFLDPFYSPGSDFIAISNTLITDLIRRDLAGQSIRRIVRQFESSYFSFYRSSLKLYQDQYELFGHARAMSAKTIWDYAYYWGVLSVLFFSGRLTDPRLLLRNGGELGELVELHGRMQRMFLDWARSEQDGDRPGVFINQSKMQLLVRLNRELTEVAEDSDQALDERLQRNAEMLRRLAEELALLAPENARPEALAKPERPDEAGTLVLQDLPAQFLEPSLKRAV
ncbi:NAD(P)/FAD-dependent oxidoreductase [Wenzhouxiangella marina]|uniref:Fumarate reductase/succinate dehydrogenase flavoprotein domain protein n=1 Tax=Wenzhouxiangella marina TaxID=1579979 RepID=A0A0K0Y0G4_9GAMM|nr:tryptophan 7-halogenase [Wenzhouxiangella marina]AKS43356.1 Fumarate reductase/succinate dehydrogenase flavoprotein domain protein [Wenzhouxiangella marina]MBB6088529.1 flavin-dependent dehydrogenase [Wenzhouxiangella marina]